MGAETEQQGSMRPPQWLGQQYVAGSQWKELDALIDTLASSGVRGADGRFQLFLLTFGLEEWLSRWDPEQDRNFQQMFADYRLATDAQRL
jgi:hypothetical protein